MKSSGSFANTCLLAAERIDYLFGQGKNFLSPQLLHTFSWEQFLNSHKCDLVKVPKIPSQIGIPVCDSTHQKKKLKLAPRNKVSLSESRKANVSPIDHSAFQADCCANQKTPYIALRESSGTKELYNSHVFKWRLKEYFLVSRTLRQVHRQHRLLQKHREFVPLNTQNKGQKPEEDKELWQEMIRLKERPIFEKVPIK